ncbi:MAG: hypothetical protein RIQ56_256 [Candidatus Parcubacteria bacterium]
MFTAISTIFASVGLLYGLLLPVFLAMLLGFFMMVSLHVSSARPAGTAKALYCYLQLSLGILLMSLSGLPAIESIFNGEPYSTNTYLALLIIFTVGGLIFLWHDFHVRSVPETSRMVPFVIYFYTFKFLGYVIGTLAFLSLLLTMLLGERPLAPDFWVSPMVLILFGALLSWSTHTEPADHVPFRSTPLGTHHHKPILALARKTVVKPKALPMPKAAKARGKKRRK